jgi:hypothetical protein
MTTMKKNKKRRKDAQNSHAHFTRFEGLSGGASMAPLPALALLCCANDGVRRGATGTLAQ